MRKPLWVLGLVALLLIGGLACDSDPEEEPVDRGGLELLASGDTASATESTETDAPLATQNWREQPTAGTIDDVYYDIAKVLPGFAGLAVDDPNHALDIFMAQDTDPETVRSVLIAEFGARQGYDYTVEELSERQIDLVPVTYDWVQLYEWYRDIGFPPGANCSDIDELQNKLSYCIDGEDTSEIEEYLRDAGLPDDAFTIDVGVNNIPVDDLE